jgi:hypothetical protein
MGIRSVSGGDAPANILAESDRCVATARTARLAIVPSLSEVSLVCNHVKNEMTKKGYEL